MEDIEFEWDDEKASHNLKKHGVSFEEGATIFNDPRIATISDPDRSEDEERYVSIGILCKAAYWWSFTWSARKESV